MKKLFQLAVLTISLTTLHAQDISGRWNGALEIPGVRLRVVLHVSEGDAGYVATLDSPDQGVTGIPVTTIRFENAKLNFSIENIAAAYEGVLDDNNVFVGTFRQRGQTLPLHLSRGEIETSAPNRPQHPAEPYPYYSEEVVLKNPNVDVSLAGTLTLPAKGGKYPAVILISGSGPQNRDEELLGHKPFLVLADHLTRKGIGVLRYDDRGIGQSTGDFSSSTTADFASDVKSAIAYLRTRSDIDHQRIGLIGHSEGGLIAAMVASDSKDLAFIVMLGGPARSGYDILLMQNKLIRQAIGMNASTIAAEVELLKGGLDIVLQEEDLDQVRLKVQEYLNKELDNNPELIPEGFKKEDYMKAAIDQYTTPWFKYFLAYDPASALVNVKCPVLALIGEKDLQVPADVNLTATAASLSKGGNNDYTTKKLNNLNHLFQECERGTPDEYGVIEQTFSPLALSEISNWILKRVD